MTTKRSLAISGLVIALVCALAGCGGQPFPESDGTTPAGSDASPSAALQARLLAAIKHTNDAKTARMAIDMTMSGFGDEMGTVKVSGTGEMDLAHRRLAMKLHGEVAGQDAEVEMRLIDDTVYLETGGHWASTTATSVGTATPVPSNYLDYLQGIAGAVRVDGHEKVRGVATTRYSAVADLNRAMKRVGTPLQREALSQALRQFGVDKMPLTVWVDDAGRLRKMTLTMELGALAGQLGSASSNPEAVLTLELFDFGVPVDVQKPEGAEPIDGTSPRVLQADLRNALTAELVLYTDRQVFSADPKELRDIEPALDWGGDLTVAVGDSSARKNDVLCLSERAGPVVYSIGYVGLGPRAGTYYGKHACPKKVNDRSFAGFDSSW